MEINAEDEKSNTLFDIFIALLKNIKLIIFGSLISGILGLLYSYTVVPIFTAKTTLIVPMQSQGALGLLGAQLGGLGVAGGSKTATDQYIAYLASNSITDAVIKNFDLKNSYGTKYQKIARDTLRGAVKFTADKKAGLISITVEDKDPVFAANVANYYVSALGVFLAELTKKESSNKRGLLEVQLDEVMKKPYSSPFVRDLLIQSLIREYEYAGLEEKKKNQYVAQVDIAQPPELKSKPSKASIAINTCLIAFFSLVFLIIFREYIKIKLKNSEVKKKFGRITEILKKSFSIWF